MSSEPSSPYLAEASLALRLRIERAALLGEGCRLAGLSGIVGLGVMAASLEHFGASQVWVWALAMLPLALSNLYFHRKLRSPALSPKALARLERLFVIRSALSGMGWGGIVFLLPDSLPVLPAALIGFVMLVIALGSTAALAVSRAAYYVFVIPMLTPLAWVFLLRYRADMPFAGWGFLAFLLFLLGFHEMCGRALLAALKRRVCSEALAREQQVIFDTAAEAILLVRNSRIVKCNRRFLELMSADSDEVVGTPMWVWHAETEDWNRHCAAAAELARRGEAYSYVAPLRCRNGDVFWAELTGRSVDPAHPEAGAVWMGSDITQRLATEAALRSSEERFRRLVSMSSDLYWEQDDQLRFTQISGAGLDLLGEGLTAVIGTHFWEFPGLEGVPAEQWVLHRSLVEARKPFRDFVFQFVDRGGERRWFSCSGNPIWDERQNFLGYHGVASEITERIRAAERYRHLAYHDSLTGLPNRRLLADRLEQAIALARRRNAQVALMLLDLDSFKAINDTDGHAVGDAVLATMAHRLRTAVRETDTIARIGGDEFVVLLPEIESEDAAVAIAEKIIAAVRAPLDSQMRSYRLGVSIGIAFFPDDGENGERLLQQADSAMYRAKEAGGHCSFFARHI
ncbi:diguanylate cyclase domain-containing protein [Niveibacterium terrae]|uniref:diguanylate cyclase domain-containing protein n=1 Tax=Niveibacterium terrae TaxID=3373598 RepID=UPI003A8FE03D